MKAPVSPLQSYTLVLKQRYRCGPTQTAWDSACKEQAGFQSRVGFAEIIAALYPFSARKYDVIFCIVARL